MQPQPPSDRSDSAAQGPIATRVPKPLSEFLQQPRAWLQRPLRILRLELSTGAWLAIALVGQAFSFGLGLAMLVALANVPGVREYVGLAAIGLTGCFSLLFFYAMCRVLLRSFVVYTIFALILAGLAFSVNDVLLDHGIFAPLTLRTVIGLGLAFAALTLTVFRERLPAPLHAALAPLLALGLALSLAFCAAIAPLFLFGWIAIPFAGIGLLTYSPLFAAVAFAGALFLGDRSLRQRDARVSLWTGRGLALASLAGVCGYFAWFSVQWNAAAEIAGQVSSENRTTLASRTDQRAARPESRADGFDSSAKPVDPSNAGAPLLAGANDRDAGRVAIAFGEDLPQWTRLGLAFPANSPGEMFLEAQAGGGRWNRFFAGGDYFDPAAALAKLIAPNPLRLSAVQRDGIRRLAFGADHVGLDRLWRGEGLQTTDVQARIELLPEARLAYTELTLSVYNSDSTQQEAIYTLHAPAGSAASQLSLWIGGEESPARLTFASLAQSSYQEVVGVERRDPALLEWMDGGRFRLRVFPVLGENYRTVRLGLISPLREEGARLIYEAPRFEGVPTENAKLEVRLAAALPDGASEDVRRELEASLRGEGLPLGRLDDVPPTDAAGPAPAAEIRVGGERAALYSFSGGFRPDWRISMAAPQRKRGFFRRDGNVYFVQDLIYSEQSFTPEAIYLAPSTGRDGSLGVEDWMEALEIVFGSKPAEAVVRMALGESLHTLDSAEAGVALLEANGLPRGNPFPFYLLRSSDEQALLIAAQDGAELPFGDLAGSAFAERTEAFFGARRRNVAFLTLDGSRGSRYLQSLAELGRTQPVGTSTEDLLRTLASESLRIPLSDERHTPIPEAGITIVRFPARPGSATQAAYQSGVPGTEASATAANAGAAGEAEDAPSELQAGADALARLVYYRRVLDQLGQRRFGRDTDHADLLQTARDAYVVTPISSLVVLESLADYERFGIERGESELGMSKSALALDASAGTVPEPEEYALMALLAGALAWLYRRRLAEFARSLGMRAGFAA